MATETCSVCGLPFEYWLVASYRAPKTCLACLDMMDAEAREREKAQQLKIKHELIWDRICPPESPYRFTDEAQLPCQQRTKAALLWNYGPKGLILFGPTRRGKTRTLFLILRKLHDKYKSIQFFGPGAFEQTCHECYAHKGATGLKDAQTRDVLALDDFGANKFGAKAEAEFFSVFEARIKAGKPTLFTLNQRGHELAKQLRMGDQIVSRMREFCYSIFFG